MTRTGVFPPGGQLRSPENLASLSHHRDVPVTPEHKVSLSQPLPAEPSFTQDNPSATPIAGRAHGQAMPNLAGFRIPSALRRVPREKMAVLLAVPGEPRIGDIALVQVAAIEIGRASCRERGERW